MAFVPAAPVASTTVTYGRITAVRQVNIQNEGAQAAGTLNVPDWAHVEAGLRTWDKYAPFPEEMNRRLVSAVADLHFAPTRQACANLRAEGIPEARIAFVLNVEKTKKAMEILR